MKPKGYPNIVADGITLELVKSPLCLTETLKETFFASVFENHVLIVLKSNQTHLEKVKDEERLRQQHTKSARGRQGCERMKMERKLER